MSIKKEYVSLSKKGHCRAGGLRSSRVDLTSENDFDAISAWSPALFFVIASTELGALLTASAMALHRVLHNYAQSSSTIGVGIIPIKKGALSLIVHLPSHANSQVALASLVCITTMYELARPSCSASIDFSLGSFLLLLGFILIRHSSTVRRRRRRRSKRM